MKKTIVNIDRITVNYRCDNCEKTETDVPVQESIYDGPPICLNCGEEMELDEAYIES